MLAHSLTVCGLACQPLTVFSYDHNRLVDSRLFTVRNVLRQNLKACIAHNSGPSSQTSLRKKSMVAQATVGRVLSDLGENTRIETVAKLAKAYGLEAWQLLVPGMDPSNPPVLRSASKTEQEMYDRLLRAAEEIAKYKP